MSSEKIIETPAVLIDLEVAKKNITRFQEHCDQYSIALRPHIKTHKLPSMAKLQIAAGAVGITCQKIGEAEVMADAGILDILITYNILGASKLARLAKLARRCNLSVVADNAVVVKGLSQTFSQEKKSLEILIECDTGAGRCGVQTTDAVVELAKIIYSSKGLTLGGLMTYPPMGKSQQVENWLKKAKDALATNDLPCPKISSGGTPNMWKSQEVPIADEHRSGTYIYNDRSLINTGHCTRNDCALSVRATVVSTPTPDRAIIDAGSKMLTSDLLGMKGFGLIVEAPDAQLVSLSEEHGIINLSESTWQPKVGELIHIIPNHACVVTNMVDHVYLIEGNRIEKTPVLARGRVT
ncbi:D-TA family PLP-dependent enzyme [Kiloniella antarctica]|uniref:D-TA family PLP-dependent enzyme n=1 Tax=Kiloniella antarctica TaxID=1550907 RepID=A0ABW5BK52_9PROT